VKEKYRNYEKLTDKDRQEMKVDETFALYLFHTSKKVNETFYKTILNFTILYRECLNDIGWSKIENEEIENNA
jgi:hypothetical protein